MLRANSFLIPSIASTLLVQQVHLQKLHCHILVLLFKSQHKQVISHAWFIHRQLFAGALLRVGLTDTFPFFIKGNFPRKLTIIYTYSCLHMQMAIQLRLYNPIFVLSED